MSENDYISLIEATKYCDYSQEYLSLRARQGKLKAIKFGRNWVTKKEWLEEYLKSSSKKHKEVKRPAISFSNLFKQPKLRYALRYAVAGALVFSLLTAGIVFGKDAIWSARETITKTSIELFDTVSDTMFSIVKEIKISSNQIVVNIKSIKKPSLPELPELSIPNISIPEMSIPEIDLHPIQDFKETMSFVADMSSMGVSVVSQKADNALDELIIVIGGSIINSKTYLAEVAGETGDDFKYGLNVFQKFSRWYGEQAGIIGKAIKEAPSNIGEKIINTGIAFKQGYQNTNDFVEEKLSRTYQIIKSPFVKAYEFLVSPWGEKPEKKVVVEKIDEALKQELEIIQARIEKMEREGLPQKEIIKEIQRITQIEPVKEITKELKILDEESLAEFKTQLAAITGWETDIENLQAITKKLQATPPQTVVSSAPIYIGAQGVQVGGHGTFASLGVSGSAAFHDLSVGDDTVLGGDTSDKLTVAATSTFSGPVTINNTLTQSTGQVTLGGNVDATAGLDVTGADLTVGGTNFTVDTDGNVIVAGDFTVSGAQTYSGAAIFTVSSASDGLRVNQQGTGNVARFQTDGADNFVIANGGQITITSTSTPQLTVAYDSSNYLTVACDSSGNITFTSPASLYDVFAATGVYQLKRGTEAILAVDANGAIALTARGTNQDITITPSGTGNLNFFSTSYYMNSNGELVIGNVIPVTDSTYNLGSASVKWQNIYADNIYGTISPSGFTQGSIIFANSVGSLAEDNSNLFWDDTNNRLGVGTTTPLGMLSVAGSAAFGSSYMTTTPPADGLIVEGTVGIGVSDPDTKLEIYNNGVQLKLSFDGTDNATFEVDTNGDLTITTNGDEIFVDDHLRWTSDNTYDIGATGATRPATGYFGTSVVVAGTTTIDTNSVVGSGALTVKSTSGDLTLTNLTSGNIAITSLGNITETIAGSSTYTLTDTSTDFLTINSSGAITLTPTSGQDLSLTLATTGDFVVNTNDLFVDTSSGNVGIGTTTPLGMLSVAGSAAFGSNYMTTTPPADGLIVEGDVGIGVSDPDTKLEIYNNGVQLKLSFDGTDNATFEVDTNGDLTIATNGDEIFVDDHLRWTSDNTYDIGASGATRPATGYFGTSVVVGGSTTTLADGSIYTGASQALSMKIGGASGTELIGWDTSANFTLGDSGSTTAIDSSNWAISATGNLTGIGSIASDGNITMADNAWIGLGGSAGRIEFDNQATDEVNILGAYVGIGTSAPLGMLSVAGSAAFGSNYMTTTPPADGLIVEGDVGIGVSDPDTKLEIYKVGTQLKLSGGAADYATFAVAANGALTITTVDADAAEGDIILMPDGNIVLTSAGNITATLGDAAGANNFYIKDSGGTVQMAVNSDGDLYSLDQFHLGEYHIPKDTYKPCPTGYVLVPGNEKYGTKDFCVMKYEAKKCNNATISTSCSSGTKSDGSNDPSTNDFAASYAENKPWITIQQDANSAQKACENIGPGFHLITDAEWMTIADNITHNPINDLDTDTGLQLGNGNSSSDASYAAGSDPTVSGCNLNESLEHTDNAWDSGSCELRGTDGTGHDYGYTHDGESDFADSYSPGADGKAKIRTHVLSNGEVIWDIAGNVWEWTDATITNAHMVVPSADTDSSDWRGYFSQEVGDNGYLANAQGFNIIPNVPTSYTGTSNGIGRIYIDINDASPSGTIHAFIRGGRWDYGADAGVFTLHLSNAPSYSNSGIGFRCAGSFLRLSTFATLNVDSGTLSVDDFNHRTGVGTTEPTAKLEINGSSAKTGAENINTADGGSTTVTTTNSAFRDVHIGTALTANSLTRYVTAKASDNSVTVNLLVDWYNAGSGYSFTFKDPLLEITDDSTSRLIIRPDGSLGLGTTNPGRKLDVLESTTSIPQLRLTQQDDTNYAEMYVDATGDLTITMSGNDLLIDDNLWVCSGTCPFASVSGTGNLIVEGLVSFDSDYRQGAALTYKNAYTVIVGPGEVIVGVMQNKAEMRKNESATDINIMTSGNYATGEDPCSGGTAGSTACGKNWFVYAVADTEATTFTVKLSQYHPCWDAANGAYKSACEETAPSGLTKYRLLGYFQQRPHYIEETSTYTPGQQSTSILSLGNAIQTTTTATNGTTTTLISTGMTWVENAYAGDEVIITSGTGAGQWRNITSNTADTLTIKGNTWTAPDSTSVFDVVTTSNLYMYLPGRYVKIKDNSDTETVGKIIETQYNNADDETRIYFDTTIVPATANFNNTAPVVYSFGIIENSITSNTNLDGASLAAGIPLPGMVKVGNIAVDIYESSDAGSSVPASMYQENPWRDVNQYTARIKAEAIGKRLIKSSEWTMAGEDTPDKDYNDPGDVAGTAANGKSVAQIWNTGSWADYSGRKPKGATFDETQGTNRIKTGTAVNSFSKYNVYDLIGNVWEWTDDTMSISEVGAKFTGSNYIEAVNSSGFPIKLGTGNKPGFNYDYCWNQGSGYTYGSCPSGYSCSVAAFIRGGDWYDGATAGVFTLRLFYAPSNSSNTIGFRCAR